MLKDTLVLDSDDEYRLTGTETSPKEMVAVAIERAAMGREVGGESWEVGEKRAGLRDKAELGILLLAFHSTHGAARGDR
jgi:hypothetical protein